jgi:hypothetical protein
MRAYFAHEKQLNEAKGGTGFEQRAETAARISKEAEVRRLVVEFESKGGQIEEIIFKRPQCRCESILQKFDAHYSKGTSPASFDLDAAWVTYSSGPSEGIEDKSQQTIDTMKRFLSACWEGKKLSQPEKEQFKEQVKTVDGRKVFRECLNQYRKNGLFSLKDKGYEAVGEMLCIVLDPVQEQDDIDCAFGIMILAQTFSFDHKNTDGSTDKIFLQTAIQKHTCWRSKELWEKAIDKSLREEMDSHAQLKESDTDRRERDKSIAFGKLCTFAHNMLQFDISKELVEELIFSYATRLSLNPDHIKALTVFPAAHLPSKPWPKHTMPAPKSSLRTPRSLGGSSITSPPSKFASFHFTPLGQGSHHARSLGPQSSRFASASASAPAPAPAPASNSRRREGPSAPPNRRWSSCRCQVPRLSHDSSSRVYRKPGSFGPSRESPAADGATGSPRAESGTAEGFERRAAACARRRTTRRPIQGNRGSQHQAER